jgi:flavin-dependent dehydrogenase
MSDRVVIVGAGISGLSAGCYAAMNGYNMEIHEAHALPGEPPGGIPGGASAGRGVVQLICHEHRKRFVTSTP